MTMAPTFAFGVQMVPVLMRQGPVYRSDGTPRLACPCLAQWLPKYEALLLANGIIKKGWTLFQTYGFSSLSGDTHSPGSAADGEWLGDRALMLAREMGAVIWARLYSLGWTSGDHCHLVLPCGHNKKNAYQIDAYRGGYNGLGLNGRSGRDPWSKPKVSRTWQQGIAWADSEIARLTNPKPTLPTTEGFLMALTDSEQRAMLNRIMGGIPAGSAEGRVNPDGTPARILDSADGDYLRVTVEGLTAAVRALSSYQGLDPDLMVKVVQEAVQQSLTDLRIVSGGQ